MGKYRSRLQIIADVLSVAGNGARKMHIMYNANLSYELLVRYLAEVLDAGLVRFESGAGCYRLTRKGEKFLDRFNEYSRHCKHLDDHLNTVSIERMELERMCSA